MPSCIHHVRLSKRGSSLITLRIDSVWKFLPRWVRLSSTLEFEKVLFHSEYSLELLDQEDRVMEHTTRRAMKRNPILQGTMSPMHGRKSGMGDQEVFLLSTILLSLIRDQCVFHHFLCPLLRKSQDEVSFKGGCYTPVLQKS
jgi:hypothetical protein